MVGFEKNTEGSISIPNVSPIISENALSEMESNPKLPRFISTSSFSTGAFKIDVINRLRSASTRCCDGAPLRLRFHDGESFGGSAPAASGRTGWSPCFRNRWIRRGSPFRMATWENG